MKGRHIHIRKELGTVRVSIADWPFTTDHPVTSAPTSLEMPADLAVELIGPTLREWLMSQLEGED